MLPAQHRLRHAADVAQVNQRGRRWSQPLVVLLVHDRSGDSRPPSRFAFVASKRVGSAVVRNRAKRRLREIVRLHLAEIKPGLDCLVIARTASANADYRELEHAVLTLLGRAGALTPVPGNDPARQAMVKP